MLVTCLSWQQGTKLHSLAHIYSNAIDVSVTLIAGFGGSAEVGSTLTMWLLEVYA